jgi:hypothetical protein
MNQAGDGGRSFSGFIGIDWSGASPARGVAVACADADGTVELIAPPGRHWLRRQVLEWLLTQVTAERGRLLIGCDFGFCLPWSPINGYLSGRGSGLVTAADVWALIDTLAVDAPDLHAAAAFTHTAIAPLVWPARQPRPADWGDGSDRRRMTEKAAAAAGLGHPVSLFHLAAASKQVGQGSLAGMRMLHHLQRQAADRLLIWPFEQVRQDDGRSVLCEVFPTLFRRQARRSLSKIRDRVTLAAAVGHFGCRLAESVPAEIDDHGADAIISAAGLSVLGRSPACWQAVQHPATCRHARQEGWILGVPAPGVQSLSDQSKENRD